MAGVVGPRYGWRVPYRIVSLPAFACAGLVWVLLKDPRTERLAKAKREAQGAAVHNPGFSAFLGEGGGDAAGCMRMEDLNFGKFKSILKVRTNTLVFAQALPGCIPLSCIVTFLSDYLAVEQGMKVQASTAVTAVFGVSCLCFGLTGGSIGNKLYNGPNRDKLPLLMSAATACAAIPFMLLVNSPKSAVTNENGQPTMMAFFLALCGGCAAVTGPNIRAILMNVNSGEVRGTVFSAFTLCDDLGKGLGPSIIVAMTACFGRRTAYTMAFSGWWLSSVLLVGLRSSLSQDAARGGGSLLPMAGKRSV